MKKTLILALIIISAIIGGCAKISESAELAQGRKELENHNYDAAQDILSEVVNNDSKNEQARAMYMQARKMSSALKYEENQDYDKAIKELNDIVNIDNGSSVIKKESINKKEELEKLQAQREEDSITRKENAKKTSKNYINKAESLIIYENANEDNSQEEDVNKEDNTSKEELPSEDNNIIENGTEDTNQNKTEINQDKVQTTQDSSNQ